VRPLIDLILPLLVACASLLWASKFLSPRAFARALVAITIVAHGLCIASLYSLAPKYEYVQHPSPASEAGLRGSGKVRALGDAPVTSLGEFLALAFSRAHAAISAEGGFHRVYPLFGEWKLWRALDSYDLEEASGGLVFFPRRPNLKNASPLLGRQIQAWEPGLIRIIQAHGQPTPTIAAFLLEVEKMPRNGVMNIRAMQPTPDHGVQTIYFSPSFHPAPKKGAVPGSPADDAQILTGFSSVPLLIQDKRKVMYTEHFYFQRPYWISGPAKLDEMLLSHVSPWKRLAQDATVYIQPRLALLPRLYESAWVSWLASVPGAFVRQITALPNLWSVAWLWEYLPKQYYMLDDAIRAPTFFFKLGSLATSLLIASALWAVCARRPYFPQRWKRRKMVFLFTLATLLQIADLFVIRAY
jgi:hypothetical protein